MKTEESPTASLSQSATPTQTYAAPQWATTQIPIDPVLQQQSQTTATTAYQHYQAYTSHYPQAAYAHYPYAPQQAQHQPVVAARQPAAQQSAGSGMDTADIATLNDALGSAGVDLRAEEESLQRSHDQSQSYRSYEDRTRKQPSKPAFDTRILGTTMRAAATQHKITRIPEDSVNYLALALRARLQDLVTAMITASRHRTDTQFDRPASFYEDGVTPMWSILVRSDVAKQLAALEKVEREEEIKIRKERKERMEMAAAHAAALAAQATGAGLGDSLAGGAGGTDEEGTKRKRKKDGPGVTARNMSEDVRKKMSNAVATQAAGLGGKYAWMNAANAAAANATPKPKPAPAAPITPAPAAVATASPVTPATASPATTTAPAAGASGAAGSSWARPYVPTKKADVASTPVEEDTRTLVTLRDAMFVVEKERGHGGGKGAARGWV